MSSPIYAKHNRNVLLIRDEVGKAKPSVYRLPKGDFAFGKAEEKDGGNCAQLLSGQAAAS